MPADRGEYRSIPRVILDGKDYQELSPEARHLFLVLKISTGPAGIEVHYPEAHAIELAAQSGYSVDLVNQILTHLEGAGWIRRERNIIWITDQLRYEPGFSQKNPKHRKCVLTHVQGLPKLGIVGAFIEHYKDWLEGWEALRKGYPMGIHVYPSDTLSRVREYPLELHKTEDIRHKTEDVVGNELPRPPAGVSESQWNRVWHAVAENYRPALESFVRSARHPAAVVAEIEAVHTGLTPPGYPWEVVGKALHDLAVAGAALTSFRLAAFCRGALAQPPVDAPSDPNEGEFVRAARELMREREQAEAVAARSQP